MGLKRFYHVIQDKRGMVVNISVYGRATDAEALNGNETLNEKFFEEEWNDVREFSHSLLSEDQLKVIQHKIIQALKMK